MPSTSPTSPRNRWWVFTAVLIADVLDLLDSTITNIAAPSIVRQLHAPATLVPWLGLSYALALGSLLVIGARLGDRYGARRTFLIGLAGFTTATALVALAWAPVPLIAFRTIQGGFGALLIPQGFTLLLRVFPREELGKVFALFGPLMALSSISGPVVAALLLQVAPFGLGWRAVFALFTVLGAALLAVSAVVLPQLEPDTAAKIPVVSCALVMAGLLSLLGGIITGGQDGWGARDVALVLVGVVLLGVFGLTQRRSATPLLARALFANRGFVAGISVASLFFAAVAGLLYATSLFLQTGVHLAVLPTAALMAPMSVGIIATSFTFHSRIQQLGRRLVLAGVLTTAAGSGLFLALVPVLVGSPALITAPLAIIGAGMGCCFGSLFATALGDVDPALAGSASGALNALQQIANACGAALVSTTFLALSGRGTTTAASVSLGVVLLVLVVCLAALPILPKQAATDTH